MPVSSVAICTDGVLFKEHSPSVPLSIGIAVYHSLKSNFNILLYSSQDRKELDYTLNIESLKIHAAVEYNESPRQWLSGPERKLVQLNSLRQRGYRIELVIEPDPEAAALMLTNGFNIMNFIHSAYQVPSWRPDFTGQDRKWETLERTATAMAELKALDERIKELTEEDDWK
jgi:hypothetical protein